MLRQAVSRHRELYLEAKASVWAARYARGLPLAQHYMVLRACALALEAADLSAEHTGEVRAWLRHPRRASVLEEVQREPRDAKSPVT